MLKFWENGNGANQVCSVKNNSILLMLGLMSLSCIGSAVGDGAIEKNAYRAINLCVERYQGISGMELFPEVDRAYALVTDGKVDVLFTHHEVGAFGERSDDYRPYLACGVLSSGEISIYYLGQFMKTPLISIESVKQIIDGPYDKAWDTLFFRSGIGDFKFEKSQEYREDDITKLKGRTLD